MQFSAQAPGFNRLSKEKKKKEKKKRKDSLRESKAERKKSNSNRVQTLACAWHVIMKISIILNNAYDLLFYFD